MSQEFDNKVLDLVKHLVIPYEYMGNFEKFKKQLPSKEKHLVIPYEYMGNFEKCKKQFPSKEKFYSLLSGKKISGKECKHVL